MFDEFSSYENKIVIDKYAVMVYSGAKLSLLITGIPLLYRSDMEDQRKKQILREAVAKIVKKYRNRLGLKDRPLSFVRFAWGLTEYNRKIGSRASVSYQTIKNWADGTHLPEYIVILEITKVSPVGSWQYEFATEIISIYQVTLIDYPLSSD